MDEVVENTIRFRTLGFYAKLSVVCRWESFTVEFGMSSVLFNRWRGKYGGMDASMIAQMKGIEDENRRLKKMFAEL